MLDKDFVKQPPHKKHIQNTIEDKMQEIILGEGKLYKIEQWFVDLPMWIKHNHFL